MERTEADISVIIPAHNESATIARLLRALLPNGPKARCEVIVVCNGCTDSTASIARSFAGVNVLQIREASKFSALKVGDSQATGNSRAFVDADVEIDGASIVALMDALTESSALAAGPVRNLPRDGVAAPVRWFYDVWERLPQVENGLFGRGVIAISESGMGRVRSMPRTIADDLVISELFSAQERVVVSSAQVVIHPPRTVGDLVRRRVRAVHGNAQADEQGLRHQDSQTSMTSLVKIARESPTLALKVAVFVSVGLGARGWAFLQTRRKKPIVWMRDESSRAC